ncbi:hypothetical protein LIER_14310 [Lithospermum erythrorhizon]|uniref:Uncharacterized protein n=1 Tax=Lithospermum erythrorhizon TaxID=34254 RepID=A0AAV3Q1Y8_LITER
MEQEAQQPFTPQPSTTQYLSSQSVNSYNPSSRNIMPAIIPISTTPHTIPKSNTLSSSKPWANERQHRKDKGLCYHYEAPFSPGHRYKSALTIRECRDNTNNALWEAAEEEARLYEHLEAEDNATSIPYLPH